MPITIAIVVGAARPGSLTTLVANQAAELLAGEVVHVDIIHPGALGLPLPGTGSDAPGVLELRERVGRADGILLATPEYQGSFSSVLKLALEHLGWPAEIAAKPVGLLGVAAGRIGAIKSLEHLRSVASHLGGRVLPQGVSIAQVKEGLTDDGLLSRAGDREALEALTESLLLETLARSARTHTAGLSRVA